MKAIRIGIVLVILLGVAFIASAQTGPNPVKSADALTTRTFVLVQNHLAMTTKKTAYVLAEDGEIEVSAWRWDATGTVWNRVLPNPALYDDIGATHADSVMICPSGYVLPITGEFDALTLRGVLGTVSCQIQVYK